MKNWTIIIAAILISASIVFYALSDRYYIDTSTDIKIDRLTGQTYKLGSSSNGLWGNTTYYWKKIE
jgi:hypothetical protein